MVRIQNFISSAASRIADAAESVAGTAQSVADTATNLAEGLSRAGEEGSIEQDLWEKAIDPGRLTSGVKDLGEAARAKAEMIKDAVVGQAATQVSTGVSKLANWVDPGVQMLSEIKETREAAQRAVEEEIASFTPEAALQAFEEATTQIGELAEAITTDIDDFERGVRSTVGDTRNEVINAVTNAAAQVVIANREAIQELGAGIGDAAQILSDLPFVGAEKEGVTRKVLNTLFPQVNAGITMAQWATEATGRAVEASVEVAEYMQDSEGLLTKANVDAWLEEIEPGMTRVVEGSLSAELAIGVGIDLERNQGFSLKRSVENPNEMTLTFAAGSDVGAVLGKRAQGQGAGLSVGSQMATTVAFAFDLRNEQEKTMLRDLIFGQQTGMATERAMEIADNHLTAASFAGDLAGDAKFGLGVGLEGNRSGGLTTDWRRGEDGENITRVGVQTRGELSAGASLIGRVPEGVVEGLIASAPADGAEAASKIMAALSGGHLGTEMSVGSELRMGLEFHEKELDHIYLEGQVDGAFLGHQGQIDVKLTIHDVGELAPLVGASVSDLQAQLQSASLDLSALLQAAEKRGLDPSQFLGLSASASRTIEEGIDLSTGVGGVKRLMMRTDPVDLFPPLGRAADPTGKDIEQALEDGQMRLLDRSLSC